jgi:hypothetical protein
MPEYVVPKGMEKLMPETPFIGNCQYKAPYSRELEGKTFDLLFDDGHEMMVTFPSRDKIIYNENDEIHCDNYLCMKAADTAFLLLTEQKHISPRTGLLMLLDFSTNLVTGIFVSQGTVSNFPNLVTRTVRFGVIRNGNSPLPSQRHYFTEELLGKKIEWAYSPEFRIIHVYCGKDSYFAAMEPKLGEKYRKQREAEGLKPIPLTTEPSIYIHLRDNLFLFSFIEKNLGSGTQGLMVINTDSVTDVGCFWGTNPVGDPEGYLFSAYGRWVTERLPEEALLGF